MVIKLYFGERSKFEHESEQILEIIKLVKENFIEDDIYILTNVLISNGDIDCILLTKEGPIILELKNYSGEVIGTENGDWFVRDNGEDVPLNTNLYVQLKLKRNDFHKKFEKIRETYFPRIEPEDLRKISAWGYFKEGSTYPNDQMNLNLMPWFSVVSKLNIVKKIRLHHTGYTLTLDDMDHIIQEINVNEWTKDMLDLLGPDEPPFESEKIVPNVSSPVQTSFSNYEPAAIINMIESMAQNGHAPEDGCILFGIGNDAHIELISKTYLENGFKRGASAEKFVVGPFGSGKTHFINQLCEVARSKNCFTSKVSLTKDVDVTSNYYIYREIVREIRSPNDSKRGVTALMESCLSSIKEMVNGQTDNPSDAEELLKMYINSFDQEDFELDAFGRVIKKAYNAYLKGDFETYDAAGRWIGGEFNDKFIAKTLNVETYPKTELNLIASRLNLSLYQFIKKSHFSGTVVAFDEAEQGFEMSKKKQSTLYSLMQSDINAINRLRDGSALILYAIVPAIKEGMMDFPALQQRINHPIPFPRNPRASLIEISRPEMSSREEIVEELCNIGNRLVDLVYSLPDSNIQVPKEDVYTSVSKLAVRTYEEDMDISGRRMMVKSTCSILSILYDTNILVDPDELSLEMQPYGIDDEV